MNTLLFTLEYPPFNGGVANYYGNLVKYWSDSSSISVLSNNDGRLINDKLPRLKWLPSYFALRQKIKQEKTNHILVGQILPLGTIAYISTRFCKIKYSVILHGLDFTGAVKSRRKKFISKIILIKAEKIICANNYVSGRVKQTFPNIAQKVIVVNPGVENRLTDKAQRLARLREKYRLNNQLVLLSVGRLIKRKGFDKVIEAMPKILKRAPNLVYAIVGDGEELENFKFQISNFKLKDKAIIINSATDEERDDWYNLCDIFIMPARNIGGDFEGFGIVYLEANLAGKPVIAGRSGGVDDAVVDGLNGLLVNPENTKDITEKIIKLAFDTELRHRLGEQGRRRAINDFSWEKQAGEIYKILGV